MTTSIKSSPDGTQAIIQVGGVDSVVIGSSGIVSGGIPVGTTILFPGTSAPTGFLKENGAAISRTTYAALFAVIGTTYGAGNGSTTFNLPDSRGEFFRCLDDGAALM